MSDGHGGSTEGGKPEWPLARAPGSAPNAVWFILLLISTVRRRARRAVKRRLHPLVGRPL